MLIIILITFISVGSVLVLVLSALSPANPNDPKKVAGRLTAALGKRTTDAQEVMLDLRRTDKLSTIPALNHLLARIEIADKIRRLLAQADSGWTAGTLLLMCSVSGLIAGLLVYMRTQVFGISLIVGCAGALLPVAFVFQKRRQRFNRFEQRLPEALDLMVSALRAGHSLVAALRLVAHESPDPIQKEFRICYEEQNYGLELRNAMANMVERVPLQDLKIIVTAILIQRESGGNLAEVLDKTGYIIRERFRLRRQIKTHTAQGRLTGWILSMLPVVLGFALYLVNPKTMSILWTNPLGIKLMYAAAVMMIVGALIIRKIVDIEL